MRLTIERLRTLVLAAGALLIVALVAFLALGRWKNRLILKELPRRLGADIQREANGFTYTQSHGGHTLFKIHASKVVQLKQDGRAQLHDVQIELYGQDGSTVDRISGGEFQYDQKAGIATAAGPVEIFIMRPGVAPAVAPGAGGRIPASPKVTAPLANAAQTAESGQIDVKTSGLVFDQNTGIASTTQRVEFAMAQGAGSSIGAEFDSDKGYLILDHDVELDVQRGAEAVRLRAGHGEFDRSQLACTLRGAVAGYRNGQATAGQAQVTFREDGSAVRLDASGGFLLTSASGAKIAAPTGTLNFDERSRPTNGLLEGGVTMDSVSSTTHVNGSAPTARLAFAAGGELRHAYLERGVAMHSEQQGQGLPRIVRDWRSPVADLSFRNNAGGQLQMASVQGTGGVVITVQSQRPGGPVLPSRMSAGQVNGEFGPRQELTRITGIGHASLEQTSAAGAHQIVNGDRLVALLAPPAQGSNSARPGAKTAPADPAQQIQSATIDGNVVLLQQQPAKPGEAAQPPMRATSGHAAYDAAGESLHLTLHPRVEDGNLQLTADLLDVSQASGDAFAHGNVKATWFDTGVSQPGKQAAPGGLDLGGQGPVHVVAGEAQLHRATSQATFRGAARLWQQSNSISAPEIVLDRTRQTLVARGSGSSQPVNLVLLSSGGAALPAQNKAAASPSIIRVRAGDFKYSAAERKAMLHAGPDGPVLAETASGTSASSEAEIVLLPPGNHAGPGGSAAQLDRLTARGHVLLNSNGRRGVGEQLVYSGESQQYRLTGAAGAWPTLTDPLHGTVTGEALIFNSRDDSVSIEGQGHKTQTQSVAPR